MRQPKDTLSGLTADALRQILDYDASTGLFRWRVNSGHSKKGEVAGYTRKDGYVVINRGRIAHRLAWLYVTGEWPKAGIDHINRNPTDNRFSNLREATVPQNHWNMKKFKNNTSGARGVWWSKQKQRWMAELWINSKKKGFGQYTTVEEASAAVEAARLKFFGKFNSAQESVS